MRFRHVAAARHVVDYNFNNTYQYVINREDLQLNWVRDAIAELGGTVPDDPAEPPIQSRGKAAEAQASIVREDRDAAQGAAQRDSAAAPAASECGVALGDLAASRGDHRCRSRMQKNFCRLIAYG